MIESFSRMWDQPAKQGSEMLAQRIIPTYVGSTPAAPSCHGGSSNHSHVCGINAPASSSMVACVESFPRMWDQLIGFLIADAVLRIIPTYVGSTVLVGGGGLCPTNHSHVCGINRKAWLEGDWDSESFPRMWDQRDERKAFCRVLRIIPTYVGST